MFVETLCFIKAGDIDVFKSKKQRDDEAIMAKLQTMPVQAVRVDNTAVVLPDDVVQMAATCAGLIGGQPLRTGHSVQAFARILKHWYARQGAVLHSVTRATIDADLSVAEISVEEPCISAAGNGTW